MVRDFLIIFAIIVTVSANELCNEGERTKVRFACDEYNECVNDEFVRKQCKIGHYFDGQECGYMWRVNCQLEACKENELYSRGNCQTKYDTCYLGKKIIKECPGDQRFDGKKCVTLESCQNTMKLERVKKIHTKLLAAKDEKKCEDGEKTFYPTDCTMYRLCVNGQWIDKSCAWLSHFDVVTKSCSYWEYTCGYGDNCTENETRSIYGRCSEYQKCENKRWRKKVCDEGTYFQDGSCQKKPCPLRPVLNNCSYFMEPNDDHKYPCPAQQLFDKVERQCVDKGAARCLEGDCEDGDTTYNNSDCTKYKLCKDLKWTDQSCPWLKHYDIKSKSCTYFSYTCGHDQTTAAVTERDQPECDNGSKRAIKENCHHYEQCQNGKWSEQKCFLWGKYDSVTNGCFYFKMWDVHCL